MKQKILFAVMCILSLLVEAQTITFDTKDYKDLGVYDAWEESPFRTGKLVGNCQVIDNFFQNSTSNLQNPNTKILAFQRSRYGSNTFGARIDLNETFEITPNYIYAHARIYTPVEGRVMLIGLGKRRERAGQSPETEQFWVMSKNNVEPNTWTDAVFPIKGAEGIDIHSLVIVPHCESPHHLTEDFACYFDDIEINTDPQPRFAGHDTNAPGNSETRERLVQQYRKANGDFCRVNDANRNGEVLAADGSRLTAYKAPFGKPLTIRMNPERGFTYDGIRVRHGFNLAGEPVVAGIRQYQDITFGKELFTDDQFTIPAQCMDGDVEIEGLFIEKKASNQ